MEDLLFEQAFGQREEKKVEFAPEDNIMDENDDIHDEYDDEYEEQNDNIDERQEFYNEGREARAGMDISEYNLQTIIDDPFFSKIQKRVEKMEMNAKKSFAFKYNEVCMKYEIKNNISQFKNIKRLEHKNPKGMLFASLIITNNKIIPEKLEEIYEKYCSDPHEKIRKEDLIRYARLIILSSK